jgi:hypothetical protein
MAIRRLVLGLLTGLVMTTAGQAASVRTTNFIVETARQDDADEFARMAEHYRKVKALEWLGKEMPTWQEPCRLRIDITGSGAGGATTFDFNGNHIRQEMKIQGKRERLMHSVLPHEVTHTVFAYHFRQPVPRWADEGGSVYSEDELERTRHDKMNVSILNQGNGIQLKALFRMTEYPRDVMTLYAQGYSVTKYLVEKSDRQTFLNFVSHGLYKGWDSACQEFYQVRNVDQLEKEWLDYLRQGGANTSAVAKGNSGAGRRPPPPAAGDAKLTVYDSAPPARPNFEPAATSRGMAPSESARPDRGGNDIGWNRPKSRPTDADIRESDRTSNNDRKPVERPAAILLPPEPVPYR